MKTKHWFALFAFAATETVLALTAFGVRRFGNPNVPFSDLFWFGVLGCGCLGGLTSLYSLIRRIPWMVVRLLTVPFLVYAGMLFTNTYVTQEDAISGALEMVGLTAFLLVWTLVVVEGIGAVRWCWRALKARFEFR